MSVSAVRLALPIRRKDALVRNAGLSVLLHVLLLAAFLMRPHPTGLTQAAGPISIDIVQEVGTSDGQKLPAPSFAPAIVAPKEAPASEPPPPASAPAPDLPEAQIPGTSVPVPPSFVPPPVPPTAMAPPAVEAPPVAAASPVPSLQAIPPPPPAPSPAPVPAPQEFALVPPLPPAPPPRTAPVRPPAPPPNVAAHPLARPAPRAPAFPAPVPFASGRLTLPPSRATPDRNSHSNGALNLSLGPAALNSLGAPPRTSKGMDASIRVEGAEVGDDWIAQLHEWWDRHSFYPQQAVINEEDGVVEIHMVITRDGHVESVEVVSSSGSRWLDMAGVSVFRNARLRPFPLSTPEAKADVYAFLHYILIRG